MWIPIVSYLRRKRAWSFPSKDLDKDPRIRYKMIKREMKRNVWTFLSRRNNIPWLLDMMLKSHGMPGDQQLSQYSYLLRTEWGLRVVLFVPHYRDDWGLYIERLSSFCKRIKGTPVLVNLRNDLNPCDLCSEYDVKYYHYSWFKNARELVKYLIHSWIIPKRSY